jgi:hypothetical protein
MVAEARQRGLELTDPNGLVKLFTQECAGNRAD